MASNITSVSKREKNIGPVQNNYELYFYTITRCYLSVETASTPLYAQETTTAQLRSHFCFLDRLVILNEDRILSKH